MNTKYKWSIGILLAVTFLLFIPFIAMQFTTEVNWNLFDFLIAGAILLCAGFMIELVVRKVKKMSNKVVFFISILIGLVLTWMELAVGIFGTPFAGS